MYIDSSRLYTGNLSQYRCWNCTLRTLGCDSVIPIPIVVDYIGSVRSITTGQIETEGYFKALGLCCSKQCALRYILDSGIDKSRQISLLYQYCNESGRIYPAPNKFVLKDYGGDLTEDQLRKIILDMQTVEKEYKYYTSPILPIGLFCVEETPIICKISQNKSIR
jgi:hypothetical protein